MCRKTNEVLENFLRSLQCVNWNKEENKKYILINLFGLLDNEIKFK